MPHAKLLLIPFVIWLAGCGERDVVASREPSPACHRKYGVRNVATMAVGL